LRWVPRRSRSGGRADRRRPRRGHAAVSGIDADPPELSCGDCRADRPDLRGSASRATAPARSTERRIRRVARAYTGVAGQENMAVMTKSRSRRWWETWNSGCAKPAGFGGEDVCAVGRPPGGCVMCWLARLRGSRLEGRAGILRPSSASGPAASCARDRARVWRSMSACVPTGGRCYRPANGATWATNSTMRRAALRSGSRSGL